jgi:predicted esterase
MGVGLSALSMQAPWRIWLMGLGTALAIWAGLAALRRRRKLTDQRGARTPPELLPPPPQLLSTLEPPVVVEPSGEHTHSVIMLHGMYCEADEWESLPSIFAQLGGEVSGVRWIFPNAPKRTVTWPHGKEDGVSAWYNYFTARGGTMEHDDIDATHLDAVTRDVHLLLEKEVMALGGDSRRVAIGGNSQGGTVAAHVALTYPRDLGALLCLCTILLDSTPVPVREAPPLPVFVFTAQHDQEYIPDFQRACYSRLVDAGFRLTSHVEPGLDHYTTSTAELHHAARWLALALHEQVLTVTYRGRPRSGAHMHRRHSPPRTKPCCPPQTLGSTVPPCAPLCAQTSQKPLVRCRRSLTSNELIE